MNLTNRLITLALVTAALIAATSCGGNKAKTETPTPTPPAANTGTATPPDTTGAAVQQPDTPNPTGTPVGEKPKDQPVDMPVATLEVPDGTPMGTDQEQAQALLTFVGNNADAPRWELTWMTGKGHLSLDKVTGIMEITLPDGTTHRYEKITREMVDGVSKGTRTWEK